MTAPGATRVSAAMTEPVRAAKGGMSFDAATTVPVRVVVSGCLAVWR